MIGVPLVDQVDLGPRTQRSGDAGTQAAIRQDVGGVFGQHLVATVGNASPNLFWRQAVGQMAGADDLHPVGKDEQAHGGADEEIAVHQGVDQQFDKGFFRHFQYTQAVDALIALHMVQIALDESHATLVLLFQAAFDVFAVEVAAVGKFGARKAHRSDEADMQATLRVFAEQQQPGKVGYAVLRQVDVFHQTQNRQAGLPDALAVAAFEVTGKGALVDVVGHGVGHGRLVGVQQARLLEHALHFFAGGDMAFVGAVLDPDAPLQIHVGFVEPLWHLDHHDQTISRLHVLAAGAQGRFDMLAGGVGQQLVEPLDVGCGQADGMASVADADDEPAATAVGQGSQLRRQRIGVAKVALELVLAVFAARQNLQEFGFCHGITRSQSAAWSSPCPCSARS